MRKQYLLLACIATISTIFSCKKDDTINNVGSTPPVVDNSEKVNGSLTSTYLVITAEFPGATSASYGEFAEAIFVRSQQLNTPMLADTVLINGFGMQELSLSNTHFLTVLDEPKLNMNDSCIWEVRDTSHAEIPSFRFSYRNPYPSILGELPDTVSKAKLLDLDVQIAGADSIVMGISGDTANAEGFITKSFSPYLGRYFFLASDIKRIRPSVQIGAKQALIIVAYKTEIREFEGKYMSFTKVYRYQTGIWINK